MIPDEWSALRAMTPARIALGRAGSSTPTRARLAFALDHARARGAVNEPFAVADIARELARRSGPAVLSVRSAVRDRDEYLLNPALGGRLDDASRAEVDAAAGHPGTAPDLVVVLGDGLSAGAVNDQGVAVALAVGDAMGERGWAVGPFVIVRNGRVAVGDEIGARLGARFVVVLIGERPGLGATRSLGAYVTLDPRPGRTDAERNCISNIRPGGTSVADGATRIVELLTRARAAGTTGVALNP